ncbi:MAG: chromate transporter [Betaproteobacteria bacterium]|jgi:chromate transporter
MSITLNFQDWVSLFLHFVSLSLLAVGGAITTAPDIHRYLVDEQHWLTHYQFTSSVAIAQGAPGPNVMFVALMGWNVGMNAAAGMSPTPNMLYAVMLALLGVLVTMVGIIVPSATLTFFSTQWAHKNRDLKGIRAFKAGLAPLVMSLLVATGWLLTGNHDNYSEDWPMWVLAAVTTVIVWRTQTHLLLLLSIGAVLGILKII